MALPFLLSDIYQKRVSCFEGGADWLARLPEVLEACVDRWALTLLPPFDLSYNYVCPVVRQDGVEAVLKIGLPTPEFACELAALQVYGGDAIVKLIDSSADLNAMLLEKINPGTMLSELEDDVLRTDIAADVMARLWKPAPAEHAFPTTADWAKGMERLRDRYDGGTGPYPTAVVETAEGLFHDLLASEGERVLLHGDFHHFNILRGQRGPWLALDPKGLIGEREYEVGALLRNPHTDRLEDAALKSLTLRRVDQLAERLDFDRQRLIGWCHAQSVLTNWWGIEDGEPGWEPVPRLALVLNDLV